VKDEVVFDLVRTMDEVMDAVLARSSHRPRRAAPEEIVGVPVSHG
jgi:hypothetical protein